MSSLSIVAAVAAIRAATAALVRGRRSRRLDAWGAAAAELGGMQTTVTGGRATIAGLVLGVPVRVVDEGFGGSAGTAVHAGIDVLAGLAFRAGRSAASNTTGDAQFDETVEAAGDPLDLLVLLDAHTRHLLVKTIALGGVVEEGEIVLRRPGTIGARYVMETVGVLAPLARALTDAHRADAVDRLVDRATRDPVPAVRQRALKLLVAHHADDPRAKRALEISLIEAESEMKLLGAAGMGESGLDTMRRIAADSSISNAVRAAALERLVTLFPRARSLPALEKALEDRSAAARKVAIAALGKMRHRESAARLARLAMKTHDPEEAAVAAQAIGRIADPAGEPALLELLARGAGREGWEPAEREAVNALARVGSAAAVPAVQALVQSRVGGERRRAAQAAIERIQRRLVEAGGTEGQLAVVEPEKAGGEVSLAPDGGALSVAAAAGAVALAKQPGKRGA